MENCNVVNLIACTKLMAGDLCISAFPCVELQHCAFEYCGRLDARSTLSWRKNARSTLSLRRYEAYNILECRLERYPLEPFLTLQLAAIGCMIDWHSA